jgi:hypothetical protein
MDSTLRPMSTSQVLDRTFQLYRNNFLLFAGVAIVGPALSLIAGFIQLGVFGVPIMPQPGTTFDPTLLQRWVMQTLAGAVLGLIFYTIGQALATGATVYGVSMVHLGKPATIVDCYRVIKPIFGRILGILVSIYWRAGWPVFVSYALIFALFFAMPGLARGAGSPQVGLAFLMLAGFLLALAGLAGGLVWGVYAYCRYSLAIPACTLEKLSRKQAMARSRFLAEGSIGRLIAIYLLTAVMATVLTTVLQIPAYIFGGNIFTLKPGSQISASFFFWAYLGGFVGRALAGPIATIAIALVYYDQRVRKEAFDLQLMMQAIGQPAPPQSADAAAPGMG